MTTLEPELKEAYERLDQAIRDVTRLNEWEGLVTDWVVIAANQYYADSGRSMTGVGQILPDGGDSVPDYRVIGLLDVALTARRAGYAPEGSEDDE
ncbi:hypothetical protein [Streptomyces rubiginosohelvolus]|uniref:hypothetical protein n=1 Tax=Streptomyces rubiginosohelvolus TaxID=67362 RepID=UPI0033F282E5